MYENLKLEKGMYHITGKSFTQVLESLDPSEQYKDTPLSGLDAYERQLKRFGIHVSGICCDRVEKFFSTTDSAVLFPEFIRRAIRSGIEQSVLSELVAVHTNSESGEYQPGTFTDNEAYTTTTLQGKDLPTSSFLEQTSTVHLEKYGRTIQASYEAIRRQRLDVFGVLLRSVGVRLSGAITGKAIAQLSSGAGSTVDIAGNSLAYSDLASLYGLFSAYDMTTLLVSPSVAATILSMEQMQEMASAQPNRILLPFGAQLEKCGTMADSSIIGLDRNFALEMITCGDLLLETDKLIENQMDVITVSLRTAFRVILPDAVHVLML
jgi:hypothetical protein